MRLRFESDEEIEVTNAGVLAEALRSLNSTNNTFFVLAASDTSFLQAATYKSGFLLEKQDGDLSSHFRAHHGDQIAVFMLDDVIRLAQEYFRGESTSGAIFWQRVDLDSEQRSFPTGDGFETQINWTNSKWDEVEWKLAKFLAPFLAAYVLYLLLLEANVK